MKERRGGAGEDLISIIANATIDGEHITDCADPATARRLHQMRDNLVRIDDPTGGGVGFGNLQSIFAGPHPEIGLTEEASFL